MKNKLDTKKYALEILETINCCIVNNWFDDATINPGIVNSWFDDTIHGHLSKKEIEEIEKHLVENVDIILKTIKEAQTNEINIQ